jgi:predicted secreted protein
MDIVSGLVVFILLWWWAFFMVLPFGNKAPEDIPVGHATSAPERPRLLRKMGITTILASILFGITYALITSGLFSFRVVSSSLM